MRKESIAELDDRGFDYDYELTIWVSADKTFDEFLESLENIIAPLQITDDMFLLGEIGGKIEKIENQPPKFEGVPEEHYRFKVVVDTPGYIIWSGFSRQFVLSLTNGIRTKFESSYLVTNDQDVFVYYSGTNKQRYINPEYESWKSGELNGFKTDDTIEINA